MLRLARCQRKDRLALPLLPETISVLVTGVAATGATSGASVVAWNEISTESRPELDRDSGIRYD